MGWNHLGVGETLGLAGHQRVIVKEWHVFVIFQRQLLHHWELYAERRFTRILP